MVDSPKEYTPEVILAANIITKFKEPSHKYSIISSVHNSSCGHYALERKLLRLQKLKHKRQFQRQHVRYFIDHCPCCQKMSMLKTPIHAHGFSTSSYTQKTLRLFRQQLVYFNISVVSAHVFNFVLTMVRILLLIL
jgi:hypothetical protein